MTTDMDTVFDLPDAIIGFLATVDIATSDEIARAVNHGYKTTDLVLTLHKLVKDGAIEKRGAKEYCLPGGSSVADAAPRSDNVAREGSTSDGAIGMPAPADAAVMREEVLTILKRKTVATRTAIARALAVKSTDRRLIETLAALDGEQVIAKYTNGQYHILQQHQPDQVQRAQQPTETVAPPNTSGLIARLKAKLEQPAGRALPEAVCAKCDVLADVLDVLKAASDGSDEDKRIIRHVEELWVWLTDRAAERDE